MWAGKAVIKKRKSLALSLSLPVSVPHTPTFKQLEWCWVRKVRWKLNCNFFTWSLLAPLAFWLTRRHFSSTLHNASNYPLLLPRTSRCIGCLLTLCEEVSKITLKVKVSRSQSLSWSWFFISHLTQVFVSAKLERLTLRENETFFPLSLLRFCPPSRGRVSRMPALQSTRTWGTQRVTHSPSHTHTRTDAMKCADNCSSGLVIHLIKDTIIISTRSHTHTREDNVTEIIVIYALT